MKSLVAILGRTLLFSRLCVTRKSCVISVPVSPCWMSPLVESMTEVVTNYKFFATHTSSDEDKIVERNLNVIVCAIENDPRSSGGICASYLLELCNAGKVPIAAKLLQLLHGKSIFPGFDAYNLIMEEAGKVNKVEIVSQIFKDLLVSSESLPSSSYFSLAKGFISTSDNNFLLVRLVEEILEHTFSRSLLVITVINRIIFAFAKSRQFEKALVIFYQLKESNCKPDLVTYNTVFDMLGREGRVDEMLHEFSSMKEAGINPDFISYNTLLNQLQDAGRLDLCLVYIREMLESGIRPDLLTYTALIQSFGKSGNIEGQLRLFNEMKKSRIRPSIYIYRSLINSSKKMGKEELAIALSKEMKASLPNLAGPKDFKRKGR
ncbi:Tetratricopeptide repeat (TPR)-like superfamily protein [Euphorbia peplus]|nr:Tetratricopeptide repeat (TPR)-like superfamily protein [Euphorbia peplus]